MDKYFAKACKRIQRCDEQSEKEELKYFKDMNLNRSLISSGSGVHGARKARPSLLSAYSMAAESEFDFATVWAPLQETIVNIFQKKKPEVYYEKLFGYVEELCVRNCANQMYQRIQQLFDSYLHEQISSIQNNSSDLKTYEERVDFVRSINSFWVLLCKQTCLICRIFLMLDRTYILRDTALVSIMNLSYEMLSQNIKKHPMMLENITKELLTMVEDHRNSKAVDLNLLSSLIRMLIELQLYKKHFEPQLLEMTKKYYHVEGETLTDCLSIGDYIRHISDRIQSEEVMTTTIFSQTSAPKLLKIVRLELLGIHLNTSLRKGLHYLLDENKENELSLLFKLCRQIKNGEDAFCSIICSYTKQRTVEILSLQSSSLDYEIKMIESLLKFHQKMIRLVSVCFSNDTQIHKNVMVALSNVINERPSKPTECLAKYIDQRMKSSHKEISDVTLGKTMDEVISLLKLINGKDIFLSFFKAHLATRLLSQKSASIDSEKLLISKIRSEFGSELTSKLEGMFKDIHCSKELSVSFSQMVVTPEQRLPFDFSILVLTSCFWPTYPMYNLKLPPEIQRAILQFESFYLSNDRSNRRLKWPLSTSTCIVKSKFNQVERELEVTFLQAIVLQLFNNRDKFTVSEVASEIGLEDETETHRVILSLTCGNYPILLKNPAGLKIHNSDTVTYNADFTCKSFRVKISEVLMKENGDEESKIHEQVYYDREHQLEACIVRIMKAFHTLPHAELVQQVTNKIKFPVKEDDLKKRIENLITRDYIKRSPEFPNIYLYSE